MSGISPSVLIEGEILCLVLGTELTGTVEEEDMGSWLIETGGELLGGGETSDIGGSDSLGTKPGTCLDRRRLGNTSNLGLVTMLWGTYSLEST